MEYDIAVIGLGAMGSAAAWKAAASGASVIALDQFGAGHTNGSSHGETRIIRSVYLEGALYGDLLDRAYALWAQMEAASGETFFRRTGGVDISMRPGGVADGALQAAIECGVEHDVLEGRAIEARWPAFSTDGRAKAVFAPGSGVLMSDRANAWMQAEAAHLGADLEFDRPLRAFSRRRNGFTLETSRGPIGAKKLIIAAGAWTGRLLPRLAPLQIPERQVIAWFAAPADHAGLPIFHVEPESGERFYGMPPDAGGAIKFGLYHHRRERGLDHLAPRGVDEADIDALRAGLAYLPKVSVQPVRSMECRFTLAPEGRFLIGPMPEDRDMIVLAPCSGHGYKFAPAIGEAAAALALERDIAIDLARFALPG